jgi:hypothetical protein
MAPRGRPPKPVEEKRRTGNPGKRKLPPRPKLTALPAGDATVADPLRALGDAGRKLWDRSLQLANTWVGDADLELLQLTCEQLDERVAIRLRVAAAPADNTLRRSLRALDAQLVANLSLLGFSPTDRSRLGVGEKAQLSARDAWLAGRKQA